MESCLFCKVREREKEIIYDNDSFYSILNDNPINPGHSLVIPKRHVVSFFDLTRDEFLDLFDAIKITKEFIDNKYKLDYNIGVNEGEVAGRTINHLHIHFITRYKGDVSNPIGGVRNIMSEKEDYMKMKEDRKWQF